MRAKSGVERSPKRGGELRLADALVQARADVARNLAADAIAFVKRELLDVAARRWLNFMGRDFATGRSADQSNHKNCRAGNQSKEQNDLAHNALAACTGQCVHYAEPGKGISAVPHLAPKSAASFTAAGAGAASAARQQRDAFVRHVMLLSRPNRFAATHVIL
jgi:hypothetical protein